MATADLNFCIHMLMYTKHLPKPFRCFVDIIVIVPDESASVRIVNL